MPAPTGGGVAKADALADLVLQAILAYMPSVPHWAYNGGCWSWGDTGNNAKWTLGPERITGHYRTTLNAIPALRQFMQDPDDFYLLPPSIGSATLHIAMIDSDGAAAMGLHLDPAILEIDPYSGDFGIGFYGHVQLQASYFIMHREHGPLCFLCDVFTASNRSQTFSIAPRDSVRRRIFVEPLGVLLEVAAGRLIAASIDVSAGTVDLVLGPDGIASKFRVSLTPLRRLFKV